MKIVELSRRQRILVLTAFVAAGIFTALFAVEAVPQDLAYHLFADRRSFFSIPNFNDVMSNTGFALVAALALFTLSGARRRKRFPRPSDAWPYLVFFSGVALVSLGSAWYHLEPTTERLFWDRLPMSVAFMALTSAVVADRIDDRAGNTWGLALLVSAGMASLVYWAWTESLGRGDLRFYGLVQFLPAIVLPMILWLFPRYRYTAGRYLAWMIAWYGLSKLFEHFDGEIFTALEHTLSGHTLKHLAAAAATFMVLRMLLSNRNGPPRPASGTAPNR